MTEVDGQEKTVPPTANEVIDEECGSDTNQVEGETDAAAAARREKNRKKKARKKAKKTGMSHILLKQRCLMQLFSPFLPIHPQKQKKRTKTPNPLKQHNRSKSMILLRAFQVNCLLIVVWKAM